MGLFRDNGKENGNYCRIMGYMFGFVWSVVGCMLCPPGRSQAEIGLYPCNPDSSPSGTWDVSAFKNVKV